MSPMEDPDLTIRIEAHVIRRGKLVVVRAWHEIVTMVGPCTHEAGLAPADVRVRRSSGEEVCLRWEDFE